MEDTVVKNALSYSLASDLHNEWCRQELQAYFARVQQHAPNFKYPRQAFEAACYKGNDKRNEVELDSAYLGMNESLASRCLTDFETFIELFERGAIEVKRFTKRNLSSEEIARSGSDYKDGKENILRSFSSLSSASQADNLEAARVAIELVYDKTISGESFTSEEIEKMASVIHDEWLKRNDWVFNPEYGNPALAVPYEQLSQEEKDKDKAQIMPAQAKVQAYVDGLINVEEICAQYNLTSSSKTM